MAWSGSGLGPGRCFPVFPKGPAPAAQRGIWHPSGLWPSVPRVVEKGCIASLRGPPIGGQDSDRVSHRCSAPYTLLPLRGISPQGETRDMREKTASHILQVPFRRFSPLVAGATTFPPRWEACHLILSRLRLLVNQVPLPPLRGGTMDA